MGLEEAEGPGPSSAGLRGFPPAALPVLLSRLLNFRFHQAFRGSSGSSPRVGSEGGPVLSFGLRCTSGTRGEECCPACGGLFEIKDVHLTPEFCGGGAPNATLGNSHITLTLPKQNY